MAQVFTLSKNTIFWLGELDCAEEIYDVICETRSYLTPEVISFRDDPHAPKLFEEHCSRLKSAGRATLWDVDRKLILKLCAQPYFQRKWIIQELVLGTPAVMLCGAAFMSWGDFMNMVYTLISVNALPWPEKVSAKVHFSEKQPNYRILLLASLWRRPGREKGDLLEILHSTAAFSCVDARDHVYALLAIARKQSAPTIVPNYDLSPEKVYQNLAITLLSQERSRLPLLLYQTDRSSPLDLSLPSWVPDWAHVERAPPILPDIEQPIFHATRDRSKTLSFSQDYSIWQILGIRLCEVIATTNSLIDYFLNPAGYNPVWLPTCFVQNWKMHTWFEHCNSTAKRAHLTDKEVLGSTITCGLYRSPDFGRTPMGYGNMIFKEFEDLAELMDWCRKPGVQDVNLPQRFTMSSDSIQVLSSQLMLSIRRRFFVTSTGLCGMGPRGMQAGDSVCLFYGGDVPYVLRPAGDGLYTFVGHCYLHGMMDGEGLDLGLSEEEFRIR